MENRGKFYVMLVFLVFGVCCFGVWLGLVIYAAGICGDRERNCTVSDIDLFGACTFFANDEYNETRCSVSPCPFEEIATDSIKCWKRSLLRFVTFANARRMDGDPRRCLETQCNVEGWLDALRIMLAICWGCFFGLFMSIGLTSIWSGAV